jgi:hypothetical protein
LASAKAGILTSGAGALGALGTTQQAAAQKDAAALGASGQVLQANQQANLDAAKAAFQEERAFPAAQTDYMKSILAGSAAGQNSNTRTSDAPSGTGSPSLASQLAGAGMAAGAIGKAFPDLYSGVGSFLGSAAGSLFGFKDGGAVRLPMPQRRRQVTGALHRG